MLIFFFLIFNIIFCRSVEVEGVKGVNDSILRALNFKVVKGFGGDNLCFYGAVGYKLLTTDRHGIYINLGVGFINFKRDFVYSKEILDRDREIAYVDLGEEEMLRDVFELPQLVEEVLTGSDNLEERGDREEKHTSSVYRAKNLYFSTSIGYRLNILNFFNIVVELGLERINFEHNFFMDHKLNAELNYYDLNFNYKIGMACNFNTKFAINNLFLGIFFCKDYFTKPIIQTNQTLYHNYHKQASDMFKNRVFECYLGVNF